jgi:thimet oligopeptidase
VRLLERVLRDFRRAGVDRDDATRQRVRALAERQTALEQRFSREIRDDVRRLRVDPERLAGLPDDFLAAHPPGDDGLVELTTEYPDYVPVRTFAHDRDLRSQMLAAFQDRAWPVNDAVLHELLEVRRDLATTLGYDDWPSYDAEVKMIGSGPAIGSFIERITSLAEGPARRDHDLLLERVRQDRPEATVVSDVDKTYYAEVLRRERFDVDAQEVRRYFDFDKVRAGLLEVTGRLFGLQYVEVPDATVWHEDVTAYDVLGRGADGSTRLGRIYLDLHPRSGKYSHAAQFDLVAGVRGVQLPEGVLVCNFPRGLMEHDQVVTLFHEFGHLVHHVLGGHQEWVRFSGVATEWDFVEAPSQMLEEWAWDHTVLATFATDESGTPIPPDLVARMRTAEEFGKGYLARTQMFYAALSYELHRQVPDDITALARDLQGRYDLFEPLPDSHFSASFGHLSGYSSGYYTYMWSLVIAKDLFSVFDPEDLFDPEVAGRYRDRVIGSGGSRDAADLVADFLGRPYGVEAFERWLAR